jgi:predicted Zn-dependent protease
MKRRTRNPRAVLTSIVIFFFLLSLVEPSAFAMSTEEERQAGEEFRANVRKQLDLVQDDFANDYINDLGQYLTKALETKSFPYEFYVVKDDTLNAFAGPGGYIFVYTGLIDMMSSVDELAAVMSHEIGHVSARHLAQRMEQGKTMSLAMLAGMLAGALMGGKAGGALATGSLAAGIQKQLAYSRDDERQADTLGFKYMTESDFNPAGMTTVLKKLESASPGGTDAVPPYLLTHPAGPERVSTIEAMTSQYTLKPDSKESAEFRRVFPYFKVVCVAKSMDSQDALRYLSKEIDKSPDSPLAQFTLGVIQKEGMDYSGAIEHLVKALKAAPDLSPALIELGEAYQLQGQDRRAIEVADRVLRMDGRDRAALYLTALSYQNLEDFPKATVFYERLVSLRAVRDEVFYNLGVCYGRQGKLALAHYYTGVYFQRVFEFQNARYHLIKAEELAGNDQALKNKIREAMRGLPKGGMFSTTN